MTAAEVQARPQQVLRGVMLIVATAFAISTQDVVFKFFTSTLSVWQIFAVRALLALPFLYGMAWMQGLHRGVLAGAVQRWTLLRATFLTLTFMAFYAAIAFISLSTIGAANYIAPIFVTLLSAYAIHERVGPHGWIAVFVGFAGVLILLQPGTGAFSPWAFLPVLGALFYALAHMITRTKCQSVPLITMALSVSLTLLAAGSLMTVVLWLWQPDDALIDAYPSVLGGWSPIGPREWLALGFLALLTILIGLGTAGAYQAAPPSIVATFEYSYLIFVALWDFFFFATPPGAATILGMALIIAAGLMVLRHR